MHSFSLVSMKDATCVSLVRLSFSTLISQGDNSPHKAEISHFNRNQTHGQQEEPHLPASCPFQDVE